MQWEAVAVNADFWSQVLQGASFRKLDFALGAVMATRRKQLGEIGGFRALVDCLADDYQLGHRIARCGYQIGLCPVVVECWSPSVGWREVWRHQLRWARTIRVCQPLPYFFSIVSNGTLWPLLWALTGLPMALICAAVFWLARLLTADDLQRRLAGIFHGAASRAPACSQLFGTPLPKPVTDRRSSPSPGRLSSLWLVPMKDLLQAALWVGAFAGNHIEWRGERYWLRRDGTLTEK